MSFIKNAFSIVKDTYQEFSEHQSGDFAAAVSYSTVFSMAPLIVIIVGTFQLIVNSQSLENDLLKRIDLLIGTNGTDWLKGALVRLQKEQHGLAATLIGLGTLLFGATAVFAQLQAHLNRLWHIQAKPGKNIWSFIRARLLSLGMILVVGFLLLVSLVAETLISLLTTFTRSYLHWLQIGRGVSIIFSLGLISLLFAAIFKYLPDARIKWRDVWSGAFLTALLFTIGKMLISLYLGGSAIVSTYGAAGSLVVILIWVFYSAQILFFGAAFTVVIAKRKGHHATPRSYARIVEASAPK